MKAMHRTVLPLSLNVRPIIQHGLSLTFAIISPNATDSLGNSGSIAFLFERKGLIRISLSKITDVEEFELDAIDHGLDDLAQDGEELHIYTSFHDYGKMQKFLEEKGIEIISAELQFIPTTQKELPDGQAKEVQDSPGKTREERRRAVRFS